MSLSVIIEEPTGFRDDDLQFVGRVPHQSFGRRRPKSWGAAAPSRRQGKSSPSTSGGGGGGGRYVRGHTARSLGGLRVGGGGGGGGGGGSHHHHHRHSYSPNSPGAGTSGGLPTRPSAVPRAHFARNPRHPKSMYDVEKSMRNLQQQQSRGGRTPKLTPDMAFPDPRLAGAFRNPTAPRFRYEFDPREEDYNIKHNPLADVDTGSLFAAPGFHGRDNRGFAADDDDDDSSSDSSESEGLSLAATDADGGSSALGAGDSGAGDSAIYSTVKKRQAPVVPPPPAPAPPPLKAHKSRPGKVRSSPVLSVFLPRAVVRQEEPGPSTSRAEMEEIPPPLPAPLQPLTEEDESQADEEDDDPPKLPQDLRDMSTQTTVTVLNRRGQAEEEEEEEEAEEEEEEADTNEDRFVHIRDGQRDGQTMTHTNWEVVAPWTDQRQVTVDRSNSLAVNYRRVVAELSGSETRSEATSRGRPRHQSSRRHEEEGQHHRQRPPSPPAPRRQASQRSGLGDPPPWSPPIVPQVEQILHPMMMEGMMIDDRNMDGGLDDFERRRRAFAGFWNRCCLVVLMLLALAVIICAVLITLLYASFASNCTSSCGLVQQPAYLGGLVTLGAVAILTVFALITWCCYNVTRRQNRYKYRTREGY